MPGLRVVLDTNVLVSGLAYPNINLANKSLKNIKPHISRKRF
jgi:predicted nucleic acid-binding protein